MRRCSDPFRTQRADGITSKAGSGSSDVVLRRSFRRGVGWDLAAGKRDRELRAESTRVVDLALGPAPERARVGHRRGDDRHLVEHKVVVRAGSAGAVALFVAGWSSATASSRSRARVNTQLDTALASSTSRSRAGQKGPGRSWPRAASSRRATRALGPPRYRQGKRPCSPTCNAGVAFRYFRN